MSNETDLSKLSREDLETYARALRTEVEKLSLQVEQLTTKLNPR